MVGDQLTIDVTKDRYSTRFSTPKHSRHIIRPTLYLPTHRINRNLEGFTVFVPNKRDLIHSVNRIPFATKTKFIMSFESVLPRYFGGERTRLFAYMREALASPRCRQLIAWSKYSQRLFLATHKGTDEFEVLSQKLRIIYPNAILPTLPAPPSTSRRPLTIAFVGGHFARKGGAVAARAAEIARQQKLPLHFQIVSALQVGAEVWTDPTDKAFFDPYIKLLDGENITFQRGLPNAKVIELFRQADFSILATLGDTFGFSAVESLTVGTPVIVTPTGALPEFMVDGYNGLIIPLPIDSFGEWIHVGRSDKESRRFEQLYRDELERMAVALIDRVKPFIDAPEQLAMMRQNARATAEHYFDSQKTSPILDQLYDDAVRL